MSAPKDVEAYLAALPKGQRAALEKLRKIIRVAAPKAEEVISYGIPAFWYQGYGIVWYAAWKNHCSLYPISGAITRELKGYDTAKGTIRFAVDEPLPAALVKKLVKARIAENQKKVMKVKKVTK
jgi:uncharacterized protein YdhG (YjbR/CyaY superfamily)